MKVKKFLFLFIFFVMIKNFLMALDFWPDYKAKTAYKNKDYKKVIQILEKEQVENPDDARLNFNIGTSYYKLGEFAKADANFNRAIDNCSHDQMYLKEISNFNSGKNSCDLALSYLPKDWEKNEVEEKVFDLAITQVKKAIQRYESVLVLNKDNEKAKNKLKETKELLKKLEDKKKKQQQQQNQQQNDDKKKQDEKQKEEQKSSSEKENKSQNENKKQDEENVGSDNREENKKEGQNDKFDNEQREDKKNNINKGSHDKNSFDQNHDQKQLNVSENDNTGTFSQNQDLENKEEIGMKGFDKNNKNEDMKKKRMTALLQNLENTESKIQKRLIFQKMKGTKKLENTKQKPW